MTANVPAIILGIKKLPAVHAYGFFWRHRAIKDIAQITSYRDAVGAPCIRAQVYSFCKRQLDNRHCSMRLRWRILKLDRHNMDTNQKEFASQR